MVSVVEVIITRMIMIVVVRIVVSIVLVGMVVLRNGKAVFMFGRVMLMIIKVRRFPVMVAMSACINVCNM